jgi:drug/metabolite transporter (DMT)-like permease
MFTAILAHIFTKSEKMNKNIILGFIVAFLGVFLVIFNGRFILKLNPLGDLLAVAAAACWAVYSLIIKKIGTKYPNAYITRKVFFYCIITIIPSLYMTGFKWDVSVWLHLDVALNLLFLGIVASSVCFFLWSKVIWNIGAVKANNFIYLVPFITMVCSAVFLSEKITPFSFIGGVLIILGIYLSENVRKTK